MQLIFRKVSDVKKEKEMAERRKNDPALNHTQDHLVRKLFSKFKRGGPAAVGSFRRESQDVERGGGGGDITDNGIPLGCGREGNGHGGRGGFRDNRVEPDPSGKHGGSPTKRVIQRDRGARRSLVGGGGGWGRLKGGDDTAPPPPQPPANNPMTPVLSPDGDEGVSMAPRERRPSKDVTPADLTASLNRESDSLSAAAASYSSKPQQSATTSQEYKEIMRNMSDFKVDMRQDIHGMNGKISRMEEMMTDFIGKLNVALPQATTAAATAAEDEEEAARAHRHRRRHHRHKSHSRDRSKGADKADEEEAAADNQASKTTGGMRLVPGRKEEYL